MNFTIKNSFIVIIDVRRDIYHRIYKEFEDNKGVDRNQIRTQTRPWPTNRNERQTQYTQHYTENYSWNNMNLAKTRVSSGALKGQTTPAPLVALIV